MQVIAILLGTTVITEIGFCGALIGLVLVCGTVIAVNGTFAAFSGK